MNNLEEIIIKYKLQYNKDKTYFKFNFQYDYNAQYFTFKNYLKQCNTDIKIINIINVVNKISIDCLDFFPIYEFLKETCKNNKNIIYYLDEREILIRFSRISAGCSSLIYYNIPILLFFNGSPIFTDLNILNTNKLNKLLNTDENNNKCDICYEKVIRIHYCPTCFNNVCVTCFYKLDSFNCPFCRTEF